MLTVTQSLGIEGSVDAEIVTGFGESRWVLREVLDAETVIGFWES